MSARSVHVVGVGAQTSIGPTAPATSAAARAAVCRFKDHPFMTDAAGERMRVARVPWLPPELPLGDRVRALLQGAAQEALAAIAAPLADLRAAPRLGIVLAVSDDRPGLPPRWRQQVGDGLLPSFRDRFKTASIEVCSPGPAAGVAAIQRGGQLLLNDEATSAWSAAPTATWDPRTCCRSRPASNCMGR